MTIAPWAQSSAERWANAKSAVVLSDMRLCEPAGALSPRYKRGRWKVIPYETLDGVVGSMIWASPITGAPPVTLPLNATGWHAIFVGLFSTSEAPSFAWFKLTGDEAAVARSNRSDEGYGNLAELFVKVAKLDGESLVISQQFPAGACGCGVAYVKLVPLSETEAAAYQRDRADASTRRLIATNDGFSTNFYHRPVTREALLAQVEGLRGTDFGTMILHSFGADRVAYKSAHGHNPGLDMDDFPREGDRHFVESIRAFTEQGINPTKELIDAGRRAGMKVYVGIRPAGWSFFEPYTEFWEPPFYREHPEWRCFDRDGTPVTRMSWAVPQVRKHLVDLLAEMVSLGADGAHIVFCRGYPLVLYEQPFIEAFRDRHSIDPRTIDEADARITAMRVAFVSNFMRELRDAMDAEQRRRGDGKRLDVSVMVLGSERDNLQYGLDLRHLVRARLIDEIHIYPWDFGGSAEYDLAFFREICAPAGVPFFPTPYPAQWRGRSELEQVIDFYAQGAAGVACFDADHMAYSAELNRWLGLARAGHIDETKARIAATPPPIVRKTFKRLGDQARDGRYGPYWGG